MSLKTGDRLCAQNSSCEVIVIRGSDSDAALLCAGVEMVALGQAAGIPRLTDGPVIQLGKRYADDDGVEVLCTRTGIGPLVLGEHELTLKAPRPLPASD